MGSKVLSLCRNYKSEERTEMHMDEETIGRAKAHLPQISEIKEAENVLEEENREFDLILTYIGTYITQQEVEEIITQEVKDVEKKLGAFIPRTKPLMDSTFEKDYIMFNEDRSIYKGNWLYWKGNFEKHGNGLLINEDGSKFEGNWEHDEIVGYGRYINHTGAYYEGEWKNEVACGKGTYCDVEGNVYSGEWVNDQLNGQGSEKMNNGYAYVGEYVNGDKTGKGKFTWDDGSYYDGDFLNSVLTGKGFFRFSDGRTYEGEWKNNKLHGKGKFVWPNGNYYEGSFVNDFKEGFGIFHSKERTYEGNWKNGKQHGKGKLTYTSSSSDNLSNPPNIITGTWRFGKLIKRDDGVIQQTNEPLRSDHNDLEAANDNNTNIKIISKKSSKVSNSLNN